MPNPVITPKKESARGAEAIKGDFYRELSIDDKTRQAIDKEARTVDLTFSSEEKLVDRFFGQEQLVHDKNSADLKRLNDGGALLKDHDRTKQIGVVESARIDTKEKVGRAVVRFSKGDLGSAVFNDVVDGIVRNVSVGFRITKFEVTEREGMDDLIRVLKWEVFEISFVSIPADEFVGVGREQEIIKPKLETRKDTKMNLEELLALQKAGTITEGQKRELDALQKPAESAPVVDIKQVGAEAVKIDRERMADIKKVMDSFKGNDAIRSMGEKAITDGTSAVDFQGRALIELGQAREVDPDAGPEAGRGAHLGMPEKEAAKYSIRAAIAGQLKGGTFEGVELESHQELVKRFGAPRNGGFYVPMDVQMIGAQQRATQIAGVGSLGGFLVGQEDLPFVELLRNNTLMKQFVTTISGLVGDVSIPKQTAASTFEWIAEQGEATASNITLGQIQMTPKTASGSVPMSRQLLMQSSPSIDSLVMSDLAKVLGIGIDLAIIDGLGTSAQPLGILRTSGVNTSSTSSVDWTKIVALETALADANGLSGSINFIGTNAVRGKLKTTDKASGAAQFIWVNNEVNGIPAWATTQMPSGNIIQGDLSTVVLGEWGVLEIKTIDQGVNYKKGEVELLSFVSLDVAVRQPGKIVISTDFS